MCKYAYKLRDGSYWCFNRKAKRCVGFNKCQWLKWYKDFWGNKVIGAEE